MNQYLAEQLRRFHEVAQRCIREGHEWGGWTYTLEGYRTAHCRGCSATKTERYGPTYDR